MDAVELSYPVDVAVPVKLTGSDDFGGARVQGKEVREQSRVPVHASSSIEHFGTSIERKGATNDKDASESSLRHRLLHPHEFAQVRLAKLENEVASDQPNSGSTDFLSPPLRVEGSGLHRKAGKMSRSIIGPSKRLKVALSEDVNFPGVNGVNDTSNRQGLCNVKCTNADKTLNVKQKNHVSGKRGDKRYSKTPARTMANLCSAAGENNFFGVYGLKPNINDVTKLLDDISLNEILNCTYKCDPSGKGKKVESSNEAFLISVKKACSALPVARPVQSHDSCDEDKGDICVPDMSSCDNHGHNKPETSTNPLDFPLCEPKEVLERIALPPPRDLESLLQDASKPPQNIRNTFDQRPGRQISRRVNLPSFPWSNAFNWHAKANSEAVKLLASRTPCQGQWARIENTLCASAARSNPFRDLESFTFDQNLVPLAPKLGTTENEVPLSVCGGLSCCQCSLSTATYTKVPYVSTESGVELKEEENDGHCPKLLAAAQALCEIATKPLKQTPNGVMRWPKKISQKAMKACKSKSFEKPKETAISTLAFATGLNNIVKRGGTKQVTPLKRLKLSTDTSKLDHDHIEPGKNGLLNWHNSRSDKPSSSVLVRDSTVQGRQSLTNAIKQSCFTQPSFQVLDKVCNNKKKLRKLIPADWSEVREKHQ